MHSRHLLVAAACAFATTAGAATSPVLAVGQYTSTGTVASATSQCAAVGLSAGAANISSLTYPGAGKTGLTIYVPAGGSLQLCSGFPAIPAKGLNGFSGTASCAIYSVNGNVPAQPVTFSFTATTTDTHSGVGTTTISIPTTDTIGGGCTAVVDTALVFSGMVKIPK